MSSTAVHDHTPPDSVPCDTIGKEIPFAPTAVQVVALGQLTP
jgi:hypothetical protein